MMGKLLTADVFSDTVHKKLVYSGLSCIIAKGFAVDRGLKVGQSKLLLGFFSVKLRKTLGRVARCYFVRQCEDGG